MESKNYYLFAIIIAFAGLIFTCFQLWQINRNRKKQYEQLRREKTVDMVIFYIKNIRQDTKSVEKIVSRFSDDQCQDLYDFNPFIIDKHIKERICAICPNRSRCIENNKIKNELCKDNDGRYWIKDNVLEFLRTIVISYLNTLESVMLAWQLAIVDQKTIQEQFAFLDKKPQKERALEIFRSIAGQGHSYPAIEKFYQYLEQQKIKESKKTLKKIIK